MKSLATPLAKRRELLRTASSELLESAAAGLRFADTPAETRGLADITAELARRRCFAAGTIRLGHSTLFVGGG